ncbi:NAD dependent epimerase/dehydratase family protein [anaerobic digester metagenome]|nr:NAD-dependent epimerase/dehydratase family protein [Bacteroidales bacterium]
MKKDDLCLVTGASGYLATWIIQKLLTEGYRVMGTVRKLNDPKNDFLRATFPKIELHEGNLLNETDWSNIMKDVKWVFHTASPPAISKSKENKVDVGMKGMEHVFKAALSSATVQKIVMTSSEGAICFGHPPAKTVFSEDDWSITKNIGSYYKSKTLTEQVAWKLINDKKANPRNIPLTVINPGIILGPSITPNIGTSLTLIQSIIDGKIQMFPDINSFIVDVRDCAQMHLELMKTPLANGKRHLCYSIKTRMIELAESAQRLGLSTATKPPKVMPKFFMWMGKYFNEDAKTVYNINGKDISYKSLYPDVFQYEHRNLDAIIEETANSMQHIRDK